MQLMIDGILEEVVDGFIMARPHTVQFFLLTDICIREVWSVIGAEMVVIV